MTDHGLRLLLGPAPLPRKPVTLRNLPEVTKIEPFGTFEEELSSPVPVTEYNCYHSRASAAERAAKQIDQVELFVQYVAAAGVELMPSQIHPGAWRTVNAAAMSDHQTLRSGPIALHLDVLRQTGEYSQLVLPQDQPNAPTGP